MTGRALAAATAALLSVLPSVAAPAFELRVVNAAGGPVQVRTPDGAWKHLGRVVRPAVRTAPGFAAARWAQRGTVAAVATHGLRVRTADGEFPPTLSIIPRQFNAIPKRYGGHVPADSGIVTDIGAGETLFREWAPLVGSRVSLEFSGSLLPLPEGYTPAPGDVLRIAVVWPDESPRRVVFENRKGGNVTATYRDGSVRSLGLVTQPALGVGRFDGTSYTGVGAVNTNHPGVITVGTAPSVRTETSEGAAPERRGGFMIQPAGHAGDSNSGTPQMMGIASIGGEPTWEGRFPLFSSAVGLSAGFRVDMRVDEGEWEPLPALVGRIDDAFAPSRLSRTLGRAVSKGVTAFRLSLPDWNAAEARAALDALPAPPAGKEPTGVYDPVRGVVKVALKNATGPVTVLVDGALRAASSEPGFEWGWDTSREEPGRHWLEVRGRTVSGPRSVLRRVVVLPAPLP